MSLGLVFPERRARGHAVIREKLGRHPAVIRTVTEAAEILGLDVAGLTPNGTLHSVIGDSVALVVGGVAVARALIANGLRPAAAGGIGLGAVSAAVISGMLSFEDGVHIAQSDRVAPLPPPTLRDPWMMYVGALPGGRLFRAGGVRAASRMRLSDLATSLRGVGIATVIEVVPGDTFTSFVEAEFPSISSVAVARDGLRSAVRRASACEIQSTPHIDAVARISA
jgi:hypothetical protein